MYRKWLQVKEKEAEIEQSSTQIYSQKYSTMKNFDLENVFKRADAYLESC